MLRDEIDVMWQQALRDSVKDGEMFTRYHFAEMVAAKEREACAMVCDELQAPPHVSDDDVSMWDVASMECADAIRARGEA